MSDRVMRNGCRLVIDTANPDWYRRSVDTTIGETFREPRFGRVHRMLVANGLGPNLAPHLTVHVQDVYPSQCNLPGRTLSEYAATILLRAGPDVTTFSIQPDAQLGHEVGHACMEWMFRKLFFGEDEYLAARGLFGDPRLETYYHWSLAEIEAEDWRLVNGSPAAIAQRDRHMNIDLPDPRMIPALVELLRGWRMAL